MIISAEWGKGIELKASKKGNSLFDFDLEKIPATAGIYIFIRSYGKNIHEPLYVGRATDLKFRIKTHQNNLRLMLGIQNAGNGKKCLVWCSVKPKPGQRIPTLLRILEKSIIDHCLTQGHELLNVQGAREKYDSILFSGNRVSETLVGRKMVVKSK